jgi:hypothetical protein
MSDLEELTAKFMTFGLVTTNLSFRSAVDDRPLPPSANDTSEAI